jgi:hypothetical protein
MAALKKAKELEKTFATLESIFLRHGLNQAAGTLPSTRGLRPAW